METHSLHELTAAYALDALDEHDEREYEEHLRTCARCQAELASLRETAGALAYAVPAPEPPPALRGRILEAAGADGATVVPLRRRWVTPALGAAAAVAAAVAIGLGIWGAGLQSDLSTTRDALADEEAAAAILGNPNAQHHTVTGADGTLVVAPDGQAVLSLEGVDPAPAGKTYEVWVIPGETPQPSTLFDESGRDPHRPAGARRSNRRGHGRAGRRRRRADDRADDHRPGVEPDLGGSGLSFSRAPTP